MKSGIIWEGSSPIDGAPLVAIATQSRNRKTGPMVQVWILRSDISPLDAVRAGADRSICGHCPMRGDGFKGRACYVDVAKAPMSVWNAYKRGSYGWAVNGTGSFRRLFEGRSIRWGAYGDPAALPQRLVGLANQVARSRTGYTHQWAQPWAQWARGVFMASVETPAQEAKLRALGWGTFRAGLADGSDIGGATLCANERTGETCLECGRCDGRSEAIYIPSHGSGKGFVPAARLARRKAVGT